MPRFFCTSRLLPGRVIDLDPRAARHVQVLRLQPGETVTLFDGSGGEWQAVIERMGRQDVSAQLGEWLDVEREAAQEVHLALGIPANERMDWLVEKATELGVASVIPLQASRSVVRLSGERAEKKRQHWQSIAESSCEQCGRNRVPRIAPIQELLGWTGGDLPDGARFVLSTAPDAARWRAPAGAALVALSGPEGGLTAAEMEAAQGAAFLPVSLGPRILRAETAPLALLAASTL